MTWLNKGLIFTPGDFWWCRTHAMLPVAEHLEGDIYRVYFGGRDDKSVSRIGVLAMDITEGKVISVETGPILGPGELGTFDDCGVCPLWIENDEYDRAFYYMGWHRDGVVRAAEMTGVVVSDGDFKHRSRVPVLTINEHEPYSILVLTCIADGTAYYDSCDRWLSPDMPKYNIKEFDNSQDWTVRARPTIAMDYEDDETRVSCARVIGDEMWFCSAKQEGYSMKYAIRQGGKWVRKPIEIPRQDWDSEMQCYAFPIIHNGRRYLLYNGNGYGKTGIGMAAEE